jgi:hypothetical protein
MSDSELDKMGKEVLKGICRMQHDKIQKLERIIKDARNKLGEYF